MKKIYSIMICIMATALPLTFCKAQNTIDKPVVPAPVPKPKPVKKKATKTVESEPKYEDVATLKPGETYSKIYEYGSNGLAVVELKRPYGTKYGMIDKSGNLVVPLTYDDLGRNNYNSEKMFVWVEHQKLRRVKKRDNNGNWKSGFIDEFGKLVIPLIYNGSDEISLDTDMLIRVAKNGKLGCIKPDGEELVPFVYDEMDEFRNGNPAFAKKDGKYGYIDALGNVITPFRYSTAEDCFSNRAPVSIDGRYGYIDWLGNEVIPLEYEYAMPFYGGLAGVVKNGKLGFIDRYGKVVIPFEYEASTKYYSRYGASCFKHGVVALVEKNGKWGAINKRNEQVLPFIYTISSGCSLYLENDENKQTTELYQAYCGNGWRIRAETDSILASKGIAEGQHRLGYRAYMKKDYKTATSWFLKAAKQGHSAAQFYLGWMAEFGQGREKSYVDAATWYEKAVKGDNQSAMNRLGQIYYYGHLGGGKDYKRAFHLFNQAADFHDSEAMFFLGWMYEHGQATAKDMDKAFRYYLKSSQQRYERATKRLQELKNQSIPFDMRNG